MLLGRKPKFKVENLEYRVGRLTVGPKDVIVLSTNLMLDAEQCRFLQERAKQWFPDNEVLVLTAGMKLGVVKRDAESSDR